MKVIGIAAITIDGYISKGKSDKLLWSKDKHFFKKQTMGHTIIMGSQTRKNISSTLRGRKKIIIHREDNPQKILSSIEKTKCFVIGGGKTFAKFSSHLTHLYLTTHPLLFGGGTKLFDNLNIKINLKFQKQITILPEEGIIQMQYKI